MLTTLASAMMPLMRRLDPETAHGLALRALRLGLAGTLTAPDDPVLAISVLGQAFSNPIGLAAGFDKGATAAHALMRLGFGFVETGTVTPLPQPGNPRPRLFRLEEDKAVINRNGFNSAGLAPSGRAMRVHRRIEKLEQALRLSSPAPHVIRINFVDRDGKVSGTMVSSSDPSLCEPYREIEG